MTSNGVRGMFSTAMTKVETIEIETQVADHARELPRQRGSSLSEAIDIAVRATLERDRQRQTDIDLD